MNAANVREQLHSEIQAYIYGDGDDLQSYVANRLEKLTAEDLAIPQDVYNNLVNCDSDNSTADPADAWDAFESFLIDHQDQYICSSCGQSCETTVIDNGGQGRHVDLLEVSKCCEEALT